MPTGVYQRPKRSHGDKIKSLRSRLSDLCMPEPNGGCWLFEGTIDRLGYGSIAYDKLTRIKAHRASFMAFVGPIPSGVSVMHKCDVRCCVNPKHLSLGTHAENMADMVRKGRSRGTLRAI